MRRNMRRIAKEMTKQIKQGSNEGTTATEGSAVPTEVTYDEPNFMNAGASQLVK